jgi:hypothetical protein
MAQLFFTISFLYDIIPESLQVRLSAEIETVTENTYIVRNIRRIHTEESPLLPELKLLNERGKWVLHEGGKESNISKAVGDAIELHRSGSLRNADQKKDSHGQV